MRVLFFALFCLVSLLLIPTAQAQTSAPRPILAADALGMLSLQGSSLRDASLEIVPVESRDGLPPDANFTQAARLTVRRASPRPWHIQLQATPNTLVREGERVLVSFWARGALLPEASAGSRPQIEFRMEKSTAPYLEAGVKEVVLGPKWQLIQTNAGARDTFAPGTLHLNIRAGFAAQVVEIAGLSAVATPPTPKKKRPIPAMGRALPPWEPAQTGAPALRRQISLGGTWKFTPQGGAPNACPVPEYWDARPAFDVDEATYERVVTVPADWRNGRVRVDFEGVAGAAEVFANDELVTSHVGGWIPFSADVSRWAKAGESFRLKVRVRGGVAPVVDENKRPLWPMGWFGHNSRFGICFPVWLRAYGEVAIEDAFIQPSVRNGTLTVDYTLRNADSRPRTVSLHAFARLPGGSTTLPAAVFNVAPVTLAAGETRVLRALASWKNPRLWWPDDPALYNLSSTLRERVEVIDKETRRFGFREMWIENGHYKLNGVRANLLGTSTNWHIERFDTERYTQMGADSWGKTVDGLLQQNIRVLRMHMAPVPPWMLDVCDEKGLMVIAESAVYARDYLRGSDKARYLANARIWNEKWVRSQRNHASVVLWSAENEMGRSFLSWLSGAEMLTLGDAIRRADTSRPVIYDGDPEVPDQTATLHYPEGYLEEPKGGVYGWAKLVDPKRPTGIGEFLTDYGKFGERNKWWQGTWTRGLRHSGFADVRPYTLMWVLKEPDSPRARNLRLSLAPVALFDKQYDERGIEPLINAAYPALDGGARVRRTLVLFNDDWRGAKLSVRVEVKTGGVVRAQGRRKIEVPPGHYRELPCEFEVPSDAGAMDMVLSVFKGDALKFEESKRFTLTPGAFAGATSSVVELNAP